MKDEKNLSPEELKPYAGEHACRINQPEKYSKFARKNCFMKHSGKCVDVIFGINNGKSEIQALRMPTESWSKLAAETYCKDMKGNFDAAAEE
jgi:hypothetical protein